MANYSISQHFCFIMTFLSTSGDFYISYFFISTPYIQMKGPGYLGLAAVGEKSIKFILLTCYLTTYYSEIYV